MLFFLSILNAISCLMIQQGICQNKLRQFLPKDGLAAQFTYSCLQDQEGFLWISTDQGISRFDGHVFHNYGRKEGVPDLEVYKMIMDPQSTLWICGANEQPAFYHRKTDQFISVKPLLRLLGMTPPFLFYPIGRDSLLIQHSSGSSIWSFPYYQLYSFKTVGDSIQWFQKTKSGNNLYHISPQKTNANKLPYLYHYDQHICVDSQFIPGSLSGARWVAYRNMLFVFHRKLNTIQVLDQFSTKPLRWRQRELKLPGKYYWHNMDDNELVISFYDGLILRFDLKKLELIDQLKYPRYVLHYMHDNKNQTWYCLQDAGLWSETNKSLVAQVLDSSLKQPIYCITRLQKGALIAGTMFGDCIKLPFQQATNISDSLTRSTQGIRYIFPMSKTKWLAFGDKGICDEHQIFWPEVPGSCRAVAIKNKDTLVVGFDKGIFWVLPEKRRVIATGIETGNITSLTFDHQQNLWIGTRDSLLQVQQKGTRFYYTGYSNSVKTFRIQAVLTGPDSLIWVVSVNHGLMIWNKNKLQTVLPVERYPMLNSSTSLLSRNPGELWIGTRQGLMLFKYHNLIPHITVYDENDGLSSSLVHHLFMDKDQLLLATDKGVDYIQLPVTYKQTGVDLHLEKVRIHHRDTLKQDVYSMNSGSYPIDLEFSTLDLTGRHFDIRYSTDGGIQWHVLENHRLSLVLNTGDHLLLFKASDRSGRLHSKLFSIRFIISQKWYLKPGYLVLISLLVCFTLFLLYQRVAQKKQKARFKKMEQEQKLKDYEIMALKARMNPHFVFNCLSSIKNLIYDEDYEQVEVYLDQFANLMRRTLDYSGQSQITIAEEFDYIKQYLSLESLRFSDQFMFTIELPQPPFDKLLVPALLCQPFVENAIHHGLRKLSGRMGHLEISTKISEPYLIISILDNGIGRDASRKLHLLQEGHKSQGEHFSLRQAELHNIQVVITDMNDTKGLSHGTRVDIQLNLL